MSVRGVCAVLASRRIQLHIDGVIRVDVSLDEKRFTRCLQPDSATTVGMLVAAAWQGGTKSRTNCITREAANVNPGSCAQRPVVAPALTATTVSPANFWRNFGVVD